MTSAEGFDVSVGTVVDPVVLQDLGPSAGALDALNAGERYVGVEITISNATDGNAAWDPLLLRVELPDGTNTEIRSFDPGVGDWYPPREWHSGESHTATFYVKLPATAKHYVVAVGRNRSHRASVDI